jgi:hypothetical protein
MASALHILWEQSLIRTQSSCGVKAVRKLRRGREVLSIVSRSRYTYVIIDDAVLCV